MMYTKIYCLKLWTNKQTEENRIILALWTKSVTHCYYECNDEAIDHICINKMLG